MEKSYFPEIDFWFNKFWTDYKEITFVRSEQIDIPVVEDYTSQRLYGVSPLIDLSSASFIRLLFDNSYDQSTFFYNFSTENYWNFSPYISRRLKSSKDLIYNFIGDETGLYDFYHISDSSYPYTIELLQRLLEYKLTEITDLTGIDFSSLSTPLEKIMYRFLDLFVNDNYYSIEEEPLYSLDSSYLLDRLYEFYYLNMSHRYIIERARSGFALDSTASEYMVVRRKYVVGKGFEDSSNFCCDCTDVTGETYNNYIVFCGTVPYDYSNQFYMYYNSVFIDNSEYEVITDSSYIDCTDNSGFIVYWDERTFDLQFNDVFVFDYYIPIEL